MINLDKFHQNVSEEELDLIFRVALVALEVDDGEGNYEQALGVDHETMEALYALIVETLDDDTAEKRGARHAD